MLKQKYFLTGIFILSAERQPIKLSWRKIVWLLIINFGVVYYKRYPSLLKTPKADFRLFISIFYNKKAANFVKFAAFLLISSPPFLVYARNILYICCNIISFKSLVSYSFICYLQGLDSFFDYKDTTFKSICQEIHLIKYLLQAFIKSIVLLLLTFYATKQYQFYERHSLSV